MTVKIISVAKAPILNRGEVLNISLGKLMALESSAPLFCLMLTNTITAMVKSAVNPI